MIDAFLKHIPLAELYSENMYFMMRKAELTPNF